MIPVDGDGDQRLEAAGGEKTIRDHVGRAGYRAGEGVRRNFQIFARDYIYSPTLSV